MVTVLRTTDMHRRIWLLIVCVTHLLGCADPSPQTATSGLAADGYALKTTAPAPLAHCDGPGGPLEVQGEQGASGALVLGTWAQRPVAIVADADEHALHIVDTAQMQRLATTELPEAPSHIALLHGGRLAVALRHANRVVMLSAAATPAEGFTPLCEAAITQEPVALAAHRDGLLVLAGYGSELVELSASTFAVRRRIPLAREPRGLMVDRARSVAWVSYMASGHISRVDLHTEEVTDVALYRRPRDNSSRAIQGYALAATVGPSGFDRVFNPLVSSAEPDPERDRRLSYYSETPRNFEPWVGAVQAEPPAMLGAGESLSGRWRAQCVLPRAALVAQGRLWVACLDEGTVLELEPGFVDPMVGLYRQLQVAEGPSALAASHDHLFVWSLHGHALTRVVLPAPDASPTRAPVTGSALVLPRREETSWPPRRRLGRRLFTTRRDRRVSGNGSACAGCHPDGRDDGLTWGTGTTTMFLAGRLEHSAPFGWHGEAATLEERIHKTTLRLKGKGFRAAERDELEALADYVRTLRPPPPPLPQGVAQRLAIERGHKLFRDELTCNNCHPGGGTNGSRLPMSDGLFDTPPLAFVGGSPPFFHDQRYASLEAVLIDEDEPMAPTQGLAPSQRADLVAYLESLPYGVVDKNVPLRQKLVSVSADGWQADAPVVEQRDLRVHPGRYLAAPPREVASASIGSFALPDNSLLRGGAPYIWASLRDRGGALRGASSGAVLSITDAEASRGAVVPLIVASAQGGDSIEVAACRVYPKRYGTSWRGEPLYSVLCPPSGQRTPAAALGHFGLALKTNVEGRLAMLVMGPDAFPDLSGSALRVGRVGRTFSDSYLVPLAPGRHAQLVRLSDFDRFWNDSAFALKAQPGVLSVSWPEGAANPSILVADITRAQLEG